MISNEQWSTMQTGDKVKHTYTPKNRKRPVTRVMAYAPERNRDGRIALAPISESTGKPSITVYFMHHANDPFLFV